MRYRVLDRIARGCTYGELIVNDNVSIVDIQLKVDDIISRFDEEGFEWMVSDIVKQFPLEWECEYIDNVFHDMCILV